MPELRSVLVVEDNLQNLELVEFLLEEAGIAVASATDAAAALEALATTVPDVVLMDMQLPGTDGLTLVGQLRTSPRTATVPIIALTAHAMRGDRERFLAGGCDAYIAKPIDTNTFLDEVQRVLAAASQRTRRNDAER